MQVSLAVSAQNTWSDQFELLGDAHSSTKPARAMIWMTGGSTVTIRRHVSASIVPTIELTESQVFEVPATGMYSIGVATGGYVDATTITVEQ